MSELSLDGVRILIVEDDCVVADVLA